MKGISLLVVCVFFPALMNAQKVVRTYHDPEKARSRKSTMSLLIMKPGQGYTGAIMKTET